MTVVSDNTIQSSTPTTKSGSNQTSISSDGFNYIQGTDENRIEILKGTAGADIFLKSTSQNNSGGPIVDIVTDFDAGKDYLRFTDPAVRKFVYSETYQPSAGRYLTTITGVGADNTILANVTVLAPLNEVKDRLQKSDGTPLVTLAWPSDNVKEIEGDITIVYGGDPILGLGTSGNDTLTGGPSWDALRGKDGDDTLIGGGFPDGLMGGAGNDVIDGGSGNDSYGGGTGKDTFLIGMNPGEDNIIDFSKPEGDIIKITDTRVTKVTVDETKTTSGQFVSVVSGLDDKGTVLTKTFVFASKDSLMGGIQDSAGKVLFGGTTAPTDGFNYIQGVEADRIEILKGTPGADIFLTSNNSGGDIIADFDASKDYLRFTDPSITKFVYSETYNSSTGLYLTAITGVGADGTILAGATVMAPLSEVRNRLQKSNGTPLVELAWVSDSTKEIDGNLRIIYAASPQIKGTSGNDTLTGGPSWDAIRGFEGDDTLIGNGFPDGLLGGSGNDTLDGGTGNDAYAGGTGKDTFLIGMNPGEDNIIDFSKSEGDIIKITDTRVTKVTVDETKTTSGQFVSVVSGLDDKGTVLTKTFVFASKDSLGGGIQDSDGEIIFAGSTTPKTGTIPGATDGSDFLSGTPGKDIIDGKGGNDVIFGDSGADTFIQTKGSGTDYLLDFKKSEGDVLEYAADSGVTSVKVSDTVQLGLPMRQVDGLDKDGKVVVTTYTLAPTADLQGQIKDSTGKVLFGGSTTPKTGTISGTDIAETIDGTENKDTIDGKGGNDLIYGEGGADTFLEGKTSGVDTIYKFSKTEGDVIKYTDKDIVGAAVSEVTQPDGQKFSKVDGLDAAGKILVSTLVEAPVDDVKSQIRNIDNGVINVGGGNPPVAGTIFGTDIAETVDGTENKDTIDGKGGNDLIYGEGGADTFLEGKTSGVDTIYKFSKTEGDVIKYTDKDIVGAAVSEVTQPDGQKFSKVDGLDAAGKILVSTLVEAPVDDVKSQIRNIDNGIINVGGTTPPTATISGTGGSDLLIGTPQNDVFDGKGGADIIFGGKGKDVFLEGKDSASGKDYILDFRKADGDVLQFTDSTVKTVKVSDVVQLGLAMRQIDALDTDSKVVTTTYTLANKSELSGQIQDSKGTSLFDVSTTNLKDVDPNANVTLTFTVSGDQFNGSPNGVITLGDKTLTTFTATADGRARKTQEISVKVKAGDLLGQSQELRVTFTNDAASGRATPNLDDYLTDRNLRVHDLKITLPDNTVLDYDLNKAVLNQIAQGSLRSSAATDASNGPRGNILYENGSNIAINTTSLTTENLSTPSQTSNALTGSSAADTFGVSSTDALTVIKDFDKAEDKLKVSGITNSQIQAAKAEIALNGALIDFGSTSVFLSGSFSQTEADSIAKATLVG